MTTSTSADALIAALHEPGREQLLDLVRNPLRLTLLCMTWDGSSLPDTQADLYARYLRKVYEWNRNLKELRDYARRCGTTITNVKRDLNRQLGELAKAALDLPGERFRLSQALVEEFLGEELDETSLGYLALRLGWLNRVGRDGRGDSIFAFYHATFQEYFAALAVEDWDYFLPRNHVDCPVAGKRYRIFEKQWKQVILLWLGRGNVGDEEKEEFIQALVEFKDGVKDFYGYQAYFLASAAINEFKACSLADEIVKQLVTWEFGYFNTEKQEWRTFLNAIAEGARKVISETNRPLAISALIDILHHCQDQDTRMQAAESLGEIGQGNPDAIAGLLQIIRTTEDKDTRMQAAESLEKIDPGNPDVIPALLQVIRTTEDEDTRMQAAKSLGKIDPGNPHVIAVLLQIIRTAEKEYICRQAAESLGEIGQGNPDVIAALLQVIRTTEDEDTRMQAAKSLGKIDPGNPHVIAGLLKVMCTTKCVYTHLSAIRSLGEIGQGNPDAIAGLLQVMCTTKDVYAHLSAIRSLEKIDPGNPDVIAGLLQIIRTAEKEYICRQAAETLEKIGKGNLDGIAGLLQIIRTTEKEYIRRQAAESLGKIDPGNPNTIDGLLQIIRTAENEDTCRQAVESLEKIGQGNLDGIAGLLQIIRTAEKEYIRRQAAESLGRIDPGNPNTIDGLLQIIRSIEDAYIRNWECGTIFDLRPYEQVAKSLEKIDPGSPDAIAGLLQVIRTTEKKYIHRQAAESLGKTLTTGQQYAGVVTALKDCLNDEVYQNNFDQFETSYQVLWNCVENLPYPDFYQAWHNPPTTPTAPTPFTQHHNLALLPQSLNQALQSAHHPPNNQPICIDGSRFSDPTNPALQIYTALKKANCPPINNKPHTIAQLQAYCEDELSTAKIALILYEAPTDPPPQGLDPTVLNQLARFSHPPIAVILPQPLPECRLPQFLENDPDLIANILQWLQNLER